MAQRRFHYERAFEHLLRSRRVAYVSVDEAKRALGPPGSRCRAPGRGGRAPATEPAETPDSAGATSGGGGGSLKSFDFVVYGSARPNLLVDVKGRKVASAGGGTLPNWVTRDDIASLRRWSALFGEGFTPAFVFLYWCERQPADALFLDVFGFEDRWYAALAVGVEPYAAEAVARSAKWDTVSVPAARFTALAQPLTALI